MSGQGYKHLTRFRNSYCSNLQLVLCKRIDPVGCFSLCHWRFIYILYIYFLLLEESHQNRISRAGEINSLTISIFLRKMIAWVLKFSCAKRFKDWASLWYNSESSKLAVSKLASFHVCLHSFQCTPGENKRFGLKSIRWKDLLIWSSHLCLCFCFSQLGLCSGNEYSFITFVLW